MASLVYLYRNRVKYSIKQFGFYKIWIKRILLLPLLIRKNISRVVLVAKGAIIADTCEIGEVEIIGRHANLVVAENSFIGKAKLMLHGRIVIGANVCINDNVVILTASHDVLDPNWEQFSKDVKIEDYAWISTNAILMPGVHIGKGAVVGAGAVVSKNVPDYSIVVGNPAKSISKERNKNLIYNPCSFLAENRAWIVG